VIGHWNGQAMPSTTYAGASEVETDSSFDEEIEDGVYDDALNAAADTEQADHIEEIKPAKASTPLKKTVTKGTQMGRLTPAKLMERGIDELRKYASGHLKIVGASKMSGGKTSLVAAILKARKRKRR
jgi:hypothetical protein